MSKQDDPGALANAFVIGWTLAVFAAKNAAAVGVFASLQALGMSDGCAFLGGALAIWLLVSE